MYMLQTWACIINKYVWYIQHIYAYSFLLYYYILLSYLLFIWWKTSLKCSLAEGESTTNVEKLQPDKHRLYKESNFHGKTYFANGCNSERNDFVRQDLFFIVENKAKGLFFL